MTVGLFETQGRLGSEVNNVQGRVEWAAAKAPILGAKVFPSGASLVSVSELGSMQPARAIWIKTYIKPLRNGSQL